MNKKILGSLIAVGGVIATMIGTFALYAKVDADKKIDIGVTAGTGKDVTYNVTNVVAPYVSLNPDVDSTSFSFNIGATYNADGDTLYPTQDVVVGKLEVVLCGSETLIDNLTMSGTIDGYTAGTVGETTYGTAQAATKGTASQSKNTLTYSREVAVHATGQTAIFSLGLTSSISQDDFLAIAEETYSINISWTAPTEFEYAYLFGTFNGWTREADGYQMQPDIDNTTWHWVIKYSFTEQVTLKAMKGTDFSSQNKTFDAGAHTLKWTGSGSDDVFE